MRANEDQGVFARYIDLAFPNGIGPPSSLDEATVRLGVDTRAARRFREVARLTDQGDLLNEEDVRALLAFKVALDAGLPEGILVQLSRVYADALGRVAEAEARAAHFFIHDRMRAQGISVPDLTAAERTATARLLPLAEPLVLYFHHKGMERALREDLVMHVEEHAGLRVHAEIPGQLRMAVVFTDLAGFTSLSEAMGDQMAAQVLERFSSLVRDASLRHDGRVVKQIGDAFMLVFPDARSAVACALEIERRTVGEAQFPAVRSGIHCGQVLYREGDYLGTTVNVAARVAAEASRHQVLVTGTVRMETAGLPEVDFVPQGVRRLRGLAEEFELFGARIETAAVQRRVDRVCGMELREDEIAARLSLEGREHVFCSQRCLQRFVAGQERGDQGTRGP